MGLDMNAYRVKAKAVIDDFSFNHEPVDFDLDGAKTYTELMYWRKHHDLHGWMEELYHSKGGDAEFNCVPVRLTDDDLNALEEDIVSGNLPSTTGFFFGNNPPDEESNKKDLEFIQRAREAIKEGDAVYYSSWW